MVNLINSSPHNFPCLTWHLFFTITGRVWQIDQRRPYHFIRRKRIARPLYNFVSHFIAECPFEKITSEDIICIAGVNWGLLVHRKRWVFAHFHPVLATVKHACKGPVDLLVLWFYSGVSVSSDNPPLIVKFDTAVVFWFNIYLEQFNWFFDTKS